MFSKTTAKCMAILLLAVGVNVCRSFSGSLRPSKKLFSNSIKFLVNGEPTTEYDPLTFYEGHLHGTVPL